MIDTSTLAQELRIVQENLSAPYVQLDRLYRRYRSTRLAALAPILGHYQAINSLLADLIADLKNVPAPLLAGEDCDEPGAHPVGA